MARPRLAAAVLLSALLLLLLLPATSAYQPPFTNTGPAVQIMCDMAYADYMDLVDSPITVVYGAPGSPYQTDPLSCPPKANCRATNNAAPFTCWDGSCAASPLACNATAPFSCPASAVPTNGRAVKTRCWDGSCARADPWAFRALAPTTPTGTYGTLPACPPLPACRANEIRCWDFSCQDATVAGDPCAAYPYSSLVALCASLAASNATLLSAWQCCGAQAGVENTPALCGAYRGCNLNQVQCLDGSCVNLTDYRAGACQTGCKAGEFRCYGKLKGNCTANLAECPAPPSSLVISEFVAAVQPTTANATRLALRSEADGSEVGWVGVPPVNSNGTVHYNVFNYVLGAQIADPRASVCGSDWDSCKRAPLYVFSPVVGVVSYDLLLLFAESLASYSKDASKLAGGWALEFVLPVALPADVKPNKMCLAMLATKEPGKVAFRGQGAWDCVDRTAVLVENATSPYGPLYRAYAPLDLIMASEPFRHWAFVYDNSDDFGPVESIGGGFFAAGIALLVVGGTFLLANREKLVGRIYNDGTGTSTSAM